MFPKRKQIKRNELLEFILSPHDSTSSKYGKNGTLEFSNLEILKF